MKSFYVQVILILSLIFSLQFAYGQKGSVRIFCEVSGSKIFLDDELKGTDISSIDSVVAGSHYLKVTKDEIIIYGELIQVNSGQVTTILVKDTKELQDKLVAFKPEVVQQYKERN
ncbi:MAG: hypothetical protein IPM77_01990 [Crocinitomicaceae bacterium]|nr:hypothetical protein [Crocinitomicaceae bacterium]